MVSDGPFAPWNSVNIPKWRGHSNWPPVWNGPHGPGNPLPQGDVGVLKEVQPGAATLVGTRCLLVMTHNEQDYFGTLVFEDEESHKRICAVFTENIGSAISAIGSVDID